MTNEEITTVERALTLRAAVRLRGSSALLVEASVTAELAWQDLLESLDKYRDSEKRFDWIKSDYIDEYGDNSNARKLMESDDRYKTAVADAPHYARRVTAFASAYDAATARVRELLLIQASHPASTAESTSADHIVKS